MGCVSYVAIKGGGVEVGEGQGRVQLVEEKSGKSVGSSDGESQVQLGEVNVSRELKGGHSCVCQESCVDAIYMENACQGQNETGLHLFDVCVAANVAQVLEKVR